jgi:pimeloyl-ACP methyl ester carboxylesterase
MTDETNPTSHSYFSQRLRLHYADWGNTTAPHMLMVHGIRDHCHTWDWVAQRLRDRFHIVAPDLRGHGDSAWAYGSGYGNLDYVYDIAQLVRQARLEPVTLVAHSLGGTIACLYAGIRPEQVARMIIVEGVGHGFFRRFGAAPVHERLAGWIDAVWKLSAREPRRYQSLEETYERMHKANPHLSPEQAHHLTVHGSNQNEDGTYSWKFDNYTHARLPYDIPPGDVEALWQRIKCPVLFVNSKQGFPGRIGQDGSLSHFVNGRVVDIDNAGHWTHHDQLDAFMAEVDAFLNETR